MKGQYFSFDTLVASLIFLLSLTLIVNYWQYVNQERNFRQMLMYNYAMDYSINMEKELENNPNTQINSDLDSKIKNKIALPEDIKISVYISGVLKVGENVIDTQNKSQIVWRIMRVMDEINNVHEIKNVTFVAWEETK